MAGPVQGIGVPTVFGQSFQTNTFEDIDRIPADDALINEDLSLVEQTAPPVAELETSFTDTPLLNLPNDSVPLFQTANQGNSFENIPQVVSQNLYNPFGVDNRALFIDSIV